MQWFFPKVYVHQELLASPKLPGILEKIRYEQVIPVSGEVHPGGGLLLTLNRGAFIKPCPGQKGNVCCGYWVIEWGMGCTFRCQYCVLQYYANPGDVTWYLNWEALHQELDDMRRKFTGQIRLGTGEYGDSLALEDIFPLNAELIDHASRLPGVTIELKTKSDNIHSLENISGKQQVIAAFSVNPPPIISALEWDTALLPARLAAARTLAGWGYRLAFHFDPIIPIPGWQDHYREVLRKMREAIDPERVAWISLGTFRFPRGFQDVAETNFPQTSIFAEEFYPGPDGKMRYFRPLREQLYSFMFEESRAQFPKARVYACMESPEVWERLCGESWNSGRLSRYLDAAVIR